MSTAGGDYCSIRKSDFQERVMESTISKLHLKFAEKTWKETFQLVRKCMGKPRDKSKLCKPLVRSLERLQQVVNVTSMNTMMSRLEAIAKQQGMGFHITEATCYLTADLFYLEVVLLPCGGVGEVKVAPHGGSPVPSESFLRLLRSKLFVEFSMKLADLFTQYNIPGDNEIQLKLFASMQFLGNDLQQISQLPSVPMDSDPQVDMINNGRIGCLIPGEEDRPLTIQFYTTLTDEKMAATEALVQIAQVAVGVSDVTRRLQMASVLPQPPQLDPQGRPVFLPPSEAPHETFPACFLLKLQPAVPMTTSFISKLSQITDVAIPDVDLQWAPLPKLLMRHSQSSTSPGEIEDEQDTMFTVPLPGGVMHLYILAGAAWEVPFQRATAVDNIPFTHPAHVPALLALLRHQCVINTLLRSCITSQWGRAGLVCDLHFEVLPESETSFSVTFHRPDTDSLAVLLVNVCDSNQITCTLFGSEIRDPSIEEYLATVMKRSMSVPVALKALHCKLEEIPSAPPSPGLRPPATTEAENDHSAPPGTAVTGTDGAWAAFSQSAAAPEDSAGVSASARGAISEATSEVLPEINTSPAVDPHPVAPVDVFTMEDL